MNKNTQQKENLLPSPELLEKYESIYKGISKDLIELIKVEQQHRHKLQEKYLLHFRVGQFLGSIFVFYVLYIIFELSKNKSFLTPWLTIGLFGLLIILILLHINKNKTLKVNNKNHKKHNNKNHKKHFNKNNNR